jgi:hypothetical protein
MIIPDRDLGNFFKFKKTCIDFDPTLSQRKQLYVHINILILMIKHGARQYFVINFHNSIMHAIFYLHYMD